MEFSISDPNIKYDKDIQLAAKSLNAAYLEVALVAEMMRVRMLEVEDCMYLCEHLHGIERVVKECRAKFHKNSVMPS